MSVNKTDCFSLLAKLLLTLSACFASLVFSILGAAPAQAEKATRITQTHDIMGNSVMTFNANGLRLENTSGLKFTLVAKAPDWRVTIFRNDDKTYYSQSLKDFEQTGLLSGLVLTYKERTLSDEPRKASIRTNFLFDGASLVRLSGKDKMLKYLPLKYKAPELEQLDYAIFKQPTNGGITIGYQTTHNGKDFLTGMNNTGRRQTHLETSRIQEVEISSNTFKPPLGYKLAKSLNEVVTADNTRAKDADYQELFDTPGGGNTKPHLKARSH